MINFNQHEQNFKVIDKVGNGGYGSVYKVVNRLDERVYAIKKIKIETPDHKNEEEETLKVLKECRTLSLLNHENILRYYGSWIQRGAPSEANRMSVQSYESHNFVSFKNRMANNIPIERRFTGGIQGFQKLTLAKSSIKRGDSQDSSFDSFENQKDNVSPQNCKIEENDNYQDSFESPRHLHVSQRLENLLYIQTEFCDTNLELYFEERGRLLKKGLKLESNASKLFRHEMEVHPLIIYEAFSISLQLVNALKYLHTKEKLIHRDLKPTNIFMNIRSNPELIRFFFRCQIRRLWLGQEAEKCGA